MALSKSVSWPEALVGFTAGVIFSRALPVILRHLRLHGSRPRLGADFGSEVSSEELPHSYSAQTDEEYKMMLCVRSDLKMTRGKIGAQCGHAALGAYKHASRAEEYALRCWEANGQPKIAVQCKDQNELRQLKREAENLGLLTYIVRDAGKTQVPYNSATVLAVGPGPASKVNRVTGHLRLL